MITTKRTIDCLLNRPHGRGFRPGVPIITGEEGPCALCGVATLTIDYYELGKTTGAMAAKILKGEANISDMAVEYYANPVKKYNPALADEFGVTIPSDFVAIG